MHNDYVMIRKDELSRLIQERNEYRRRSMSQTVYRYGNAVSELEELANVLADDYAQFEYTLDIPMSGTLCSIYRAYLADVFETIEKFGINLNR